MMKGFNKLAAAFKALPPPMQMMIGMAGLGTPAGIFYLLQKVFFPRTPVWILMLATAAIIGGICLLMWLVVAVWHWRKGRRDKATAGAMLGTPGGPTSMDIQRVVSENNRRFTDAIRGMRERTGMSVFDLPWYIVIGDSGCGKTKLINEGGLTFSMGRPEGYQLGTLNYNWWFTEDAIFLDMAGRLCNPREDSDRREWEAMLKTIARGRPGFPLNGALVCISAEHLLEDSAEKHEQDANTMLERLRDLQGQLGVTFATYLVITKCDKILGFMQYFDRPGKDIAFKNQIFGWSVPGSYKDLMDPEEFDSHFRELYGRLHELRLRRLGDEIDEMEAGLACSFPEEFRELRDPLKTYIRTLFPAIKNPKAVKNLLFRGVYFTSATQVGEVVLRHLRQRLGEAARQLPPLEDFFPQPKPLFVKDLLFKKVFREFGLVFRNQEQVDRNRRLSKLLKYGSMAMAGLLIGALCLSGCQFSQLIGSPRLKALEVTDAFRPPGPPPTPSATLDVLRDLEGGVEKLRSEKWAARILSMGVGTNAPVNDLTQIEVRLFEEGVLKPTLREVDAALRSTKLASPDTAEAVKAAQAYMSSLEVYLKWFGCSGPKPPVGSVTFKDFITLCDVTADPKSFMNLRRKDFQTGAERYFAHVSHNPARLLAGGDITPAATIPAAVVTVHNYLMFYARLTPGHPNKTIAEWMRVRKCCDDADKAYAALVDPNRKIVTQADLMAFKEAFNKNYAAFDEALKGIAWKGERQGSFVRIPTLREAILQERRRWVDYEQLLQAAYKACGSTADAPAALGWLTTGDAAGTVWGLDRELARSLKDDVALVTQAYFGDFYAKGTFDKLVPEVNDRYDRLFTLQRVAPSDPKDEALVLTEDAEAVRKVVAKASASLQGLSLTPPKNLDAETLPGWVGQLKARLEKAVQLPGQASELNITLKQPEKWQIDSLKALHRDYESLGARGEFTLLLSTIDGRLDMVGEWGLAELYPDWCNSAESAYRIEMPAACGKGGRSAARDTAPAERRPEASAVRQPGQGGPKLREPGQPAARPPQAPEPGPSGPITPGSGIPECTTHKFLNRAAEDMVSALIYVSQIDGAYYLPDPSKRAGLHEACKTKLQEACKTYFDKYVESWAAAYKTRDLEKLKLVAEKADSWKAFSEALGRTPLTTLPKSDELIGEMDTAFTEILRALPWATVDAEGRSWNARAQTDPEWRDLAGWFNGGVDRKWPKAELGSWVIETTAAREGKYEPGARPENAIAGECKRRWAEIINGVRANASLPQEFDKNTAARALINWSGVQKLREENRLLDEKLTGQMARFMEKGRQLLSNELACIIFRVQEKHFQGILVHDGWPYRDPEGKAENATNTVESARFKQFLDEVLAAEAAFKNLENSIPDDDPSKKLLTRLFASSEEWYRFIGFSGAEAVPTPLGIEVQYLDPLDPKAPGGVVKGVEDTPQLYYRRVAYSLGLRVQQAGGAFSDRPLEISTEARGEEGKWQTQWDFKASTGAAPLTIQFAGGRRLQNQPQDCPEIPAVVLGKLSPLSFAAYLHQYGTPVEGLWITSHSIDLAKAFEEAKSPVKLGQEQKKNIGVKFSFRLSRSLPRPIERLSPNCR